ncbi:ZYRO0G07920p [Zygosaccharomyces rouxii]|uniref:Oxidant-induced cell-cycle arrest protein 5 n=1 Tax=Zygosaccharomyces rouxii (strain ATCC 2623 / CBS 732 / NBRC 1130 / NCYC 568 / NRRL Y-229) TaxID=559307 RepID=OCA5_ZYGRC|nr:uncharacterized protein ZYRO0G07920g [Zygosaccharomyces rouxii]C5DZX2.1 RecName: Full=Oxidant-induced cell-cycle arrest protein 5 [Zygosaccharomyces rouxii CBS 732]KAH9202402.1 oxidant-induced cell-cycle arrest protein 5 [Zygosaccharomyces rouxii]CAR29406.1 ZYRO0G07920p [Zygosaccharomyces rouxii]
MVENIPPVLSSHHYKHLKHLDRCKQLVETCVELLSKGDHDALAYLARTLGIPPQLRHKVWPLLLKYHPMCISPNILSNTVVWDSEHNFYKLVSGTSSSNDINKEPREGLENLILHDLKKYFRNVSKSEEDHELQVLKEAVLKFLSKWSRIFQYESGLAWIAVGLAEWIPIIENSEGPIVLNERKNHTSGTTTPNQPNPTCLSPLFKEYPLPSYLKSKLPKDSIFDFNEIYERIVLVILHCPDTITAQKLVEAESLKNSAPRRGSYAIKEGKLNYSPFLSGGDLGYQTQVFFKVFSTVLPELYQPFTEENAVQPSSKRTGWLYWWMKCSGARAFQKQDRGRLWDILLGWRPEPNRHTIDFFLNYNSKKFDHLYHSRFRNNLDFFNSTSKNDPFWFPDLDTIPLGTSKFKYDFNVFEELLDRNSYGHDAPPDPVPGNNDDDKIPFSLIDSHIQLVFIYIAILQHNEFKLLEFEETETSEFLNNVPMLSRADDICFKRLCDDDQSTYQNGFTSQEDLPKRPGSSKLRIGSDAKTSRSFNDILTMAGDIWRKWLWQELEECFVSE